MIGLAQVAVDLIAERSAGGMVEMFYCILPDVGRAFSKKFEPLLGL